MSFQIAFQLPYPFRFEVQTLFNNKIFFSYLFSMAVAEQRLIAVTKAGALFFSKQPQNIFFHFLSLYRRSASFFAPTFLPTHQKNIFHVEY